MQLFYTILKNLLTHNFGVGVGVEDTHTSGFDACTLNESTQSQVRTHFHLFYLKC